MAITAWADFTTATFLASPVPVTTAISTHGFAVLESCPGKMPTVRPPLDLAPRQPASITPPRPPHTIMTPRSAKNSPALSASLASSGEQDEYPLTAMIISWLGVLY